LRFSFEPALWILPPSPKPLSLFPGTLPYPYPNCIGTTRVPFEMAIVRDLTNIHPSTTHTKN
jgi:hypothetical protein